MVSNKILGILALICFGLFLGTFGLFVQNDATIYEKETVWRETDDGIKHAIDIYEPTHSKYDLKPVVFLVHGVGVSKEFFANFAIEYTRLGYLAYCIELRGHGGSDGRLEGTGLDWPSHIYIELPDLTQNMHEINSTLTLLGKRTDVDWTRIALVGHSMGGGTVLLANLAFPGLFKSTVAIAPMTNDDVNSTNVPNFLLIHGGIDEAFSLNTELKQFEQTLPSELKNEYVYDTLYGKFEDGTARKFVYRPMDDHVTEFVDPVVVSETVKWTHQSLFFEELEDSQIDYLDRFIYIAFGLLGCISGVLLLGLVAGAMIDQRIPIKNEGHLSNIDSPEKISVLHLMIYSVIGIPIGYAALLLLSASDAMITGAIVSSMIGLLGSYVVINCKCNFRAIGKALKPENFKRLLIELLTAIILGLLLLLGLYLFVNPFFVRVIPPISKLPLVLGFGAILFVIALLVSPVFEAIIIRISCNSTTKVQSPWQQFLLVIKRTVILFASQAIPIIGTFLMQLTLIASTFPLLLLAIVLIFMVAVDFVWVMFYQSGKTVYMPTLAMFLPFALAIVSLTSMIGT